MASNLIVKVIGAFFKIPLTHMIGVGGMQYFNAAYTIYVNFYQISTAGLPVAVSRMIASANLRGNAKEVRRIFRLAFWLFFVIGVAGTACMMFFARSFAAGANIPDSYLAMLVIAPTLFFICMSSAYRGYFQGLQNMVPTSVSQVIEAIGKFGIGLAAAWYFLNVKGYDLHVVAAFVISGVTIGVMAATVYIFVVKQVHNASASKAAPQSAEMPVRETKSLLGELIVTSIPIALASSIMGLTNTVDTFVMANRLPLTGITADAAGKFYGTYSSLVIPLFNMIPPLIYPLAISAIPALSAAIAKKDRADSEKHMSSALRIGAMLAIPCAIGMGTLSHRIIAFLFPDELIVSGDKIFSSIDLAAPALSVVAPSILFLGIIAITNAILQAYRFERYTIVSTAVGILVKFLVTFILSAVPDIGVVGSAVGTLLCYFSIMALNILFVTQKIHYVPSIRKIFLKPLVCGVLCGVAALGASALLGEGRITTIVCIAVAAVVYAVSLLLMKGVSRIDLLMLPKGEKLCALMDRFRLLEKDS